MEITDSKGKYKIKVDTERNISWETNIGVWTQEDLNRFQEELGVIIVESAVVKLQINKASAGSQGFTIQAAVNEEEASDWLAAQGF